MSLSDLWPKSFWKPGDKLFGAEGDEGLTPEQQALLKSLESGKNSSPTTQALAAQLRRDWIALGFILVYISMIPIWHYFSGTFAGLV